ncbi:hypothetical protein ACFX13_020746 [Malus domestica]
MAGNRLKLDTTSQSYLEGKTVSDIKVLISDLCRQFCNLGWVSGTGGSITIKVHEDSVPKPERLVVMSPSGVQNERMVRPGGGFTVGRFSGERELPVVYTEMDGGFNGNGAPRRAKIAIRGSRTTSISGHVFLVGDSAGIPHVQAAVIREKQEKQSQLKA